MLELGSESQGQGLVKKRTPRSLAEIRSRECLSLGPGQPVGERSRPQTGGFTFPQSACCTLKRLPGCCGREEGHRGQFPPAESDTRCGCKSGNSLLDDRAASEQIPPSTSYQKLLATLNYEDSLATCHQPELWGLVTMTNRPVGSSPAQCKGQ